MQADVFNFGQLAQSDFPTGKTSFSYVQPNYNFVDVSGPPPPTMQQTYIPPTPYLPAQQPQQKFSQITSLISQGLNAFTQTRAGAAAPPPTYAADGTPTSAGVSGAAGEIGAGLGGAADSAIAAVTKNPLLFGLGGVALLLLMMKPPGKRGRL